MKQLYKVKVSAGLEYESIADEAQSIQVGQQVVIRCEKYLDFATVCAQVGEPIADMEAFERQRAQQNKGRHVEGQGIPVIVRVATEADCRQAAENDRQAFLTHNQTMERIKAHNLEMKLIHTHYAFDHKLVIFQFSADGRIDFRELLRDLTGLLKVRVELRQVGVRDEASILGGVGTCGRPFCCASFLPSFNSINVKMAKQQGLSLNPQNISGCCGRLKCCLQYEAEAYREMNAELKARQANAANGEHAAEESKESADAAAGNAPCEDMFEGEGTILTPQQHFVAAAADGTTGNMQGITRQQHLEHRRERQQQSGQDGRRGGGQDGREQGGNGQQRRQRPQQNPQKRPLPPANSADNAEIGGTGGGRPNGQGGNGGNRPRGNDPQRYREHGDKNRNHGHGGQNGENRGPHPQNGGRPDGPRNKGGQAENKGGQAPTSIGEFGE